MDDLRVSFPQPCHEKWDEMAPAGCNRFCASCDKVIVDLSQQSFDDAAALLRSDQKPCVRARVDANGELALKSGPARGVGRMLLAIGASVGVLAMSSHVLASEKPPHGTIEGTVKQGPFIRTYVTAAGADGKSYRVRVKRDGRYKIKKLPPGTYTLEFESDCGDPWAGGTVVVSDKVTTQNDSFDPNLCIIVGMIEIENING